MIIKKLETHIILIKPKNKDNVFKELKEELSFRSGFSNSRIISMKQLDIDDPILGNKDYFLDYKEHIPIQVVSLRII